MTWASGANVILIQRIHGVNFRSLERFLASAALHSELATAALNLYRYYFPKSIMINNQNDPQEIDFKKLPHFEVTRTRPGPP